MPNCLGIMDGTDIPVQVKAKEKGAYFCYKGYTSLNMLLMCDHKGRFTHCMAGKCSFVAITQIKKNFFKIIKFSKFFTGYPGAVSDKVMW